MGQVLELLQDDRLQIVDARSEDEFCGLEKKDNKRGGAIPGAKGCNPVLRSFFGGVC
jgi:3-mercaptopyruvate sulfurtransferase SseA